MKDTIKALVEKIKNVIEFSGEIIFDDTKPDGNPENFSIQLKLIILDGNLQLAYKKD